MLPVITHPILPVVVPSTKQKINMRPMLVKEEKILLMAKVSEEDEDIFIAIRQVVNNCFIDKFDVDKLTIFDLEYLFLKLRAFSVDNIINLSFIDKEDEQTYKFDIDLSKIEVKWPENFDKKLPINETTGIILKYPSAKLYNDKNFLKEEDITKQFDLMLIECIEKIYDNDTIFKPTDYKKEEFIAFLEDLPIKVYEKLNDFMGDQPTLEYTIEYTNSKGTERKIVLNKLNDFFQLR